MAVTEGAGGTIDTFAASGGRIYNNWYIDIVDEELKSVIWIGSSRRDLRAMPQQVRKDIGQALYTAQQGMTDPAAKPLKGFGGSRVMEIVERYRTDAFRAVYTAHFETSIYGCTSSRRNRRPGLRRRSRTSI